MPEPAPEPPPPILSVHCIIAGRFVQAGEKLPCSRADLPETLAPFVVPEPESKEAQANFPLNAYHLTGRRGRWSNQQEADELASDLARQPSSEEIIAKLIRPGPLGENPPYVQVNP